MAILAAGSGGITFREDMKMKAALGLLVLLQLGMLSSSTVTYGGEPSLQPGDTGYENLSRPPEISHGRVSKVDVVGAWTSEPTLDQLGYIQVSYVFKRDGAYSQKLDMKSFCEPWVGQNCEYFWTVFDGQYSLADETLTLQQRKATSIILYRGQEDPISKDISFSPQRHEFLVKVAAGSLILKDKRTGRLEIFKPTR